MPEEHDEAQRMFNMVDTDFSGSICLDELRAYMRQENPSVSDAQVRDFFEEMDVDGSGKISKKEFLERHHALKLQREKDKRLFAAIDADKTGSIQLAELRAFMRREDPALTDAQVQELFDRLDQNRDGSVTKKEFLGTQFTRFTGTKVQILTQKAHLERYRMIHAQKLQAKKDERLFDAIDTDHSGSIGLAKLYTFMQVACCLLKRMCLMCP
jgi:Ca2+-binding EF-hand superfamily protein